MSNFEAAKLYEAVIEEVISDSRQDFEDSGIDESILQELRKIWCSNLSSANVAKFSWDDIANKDEEASTRQQNATTFQAGQDAAINQQYDLSNNYSQPKMEGLGQLESNNGLELPNISSEQVSDLSYNQNSNGIQIPGIDGLNKLEDSDTGLMFPRINQADGTIEFTMYTSKADELMDRLKNKKEKENNKKTISQADGDFDDDSEDPFNDSDDINSDLDDDVESDKEDDDVGQDEGQIMLCLYDKVQRIKNKWKSTLKEGVANINGKDYVFQKATGESEW